MQTEQESYSTTGNYHNDDGNSLRGEIGRVSGVAEDDADATAISIMSNAVAPAVAALVNVVFFRASIPSSYLTIYHYRKYPQ